jgi:hypothetical protein
MKWRGMILKYSLIGKENQKTPPSKKTRREYYPYGHKQTNKQTNKSKKNDDGQQHRN